MYESVIYCAYFYFKGRSLLLLKKLEIKWFWKFSFLIMLLQINVSEVSALLPVQISSIPSANQYKKDVTYFDLKLPPNHEENLVVKLTNSGGSPIRMQVTIKSAVTGNNGIIEYDSDKKRDQTLKYSLVDLSKYEKEVEIPANQTIDYTFTVKTPSEAFQGLVVGGVVFTEIIPSDGKAGVKSKASYTKAIVLHGTPDVVKSNIKLTKVFLQLDNYHTALFGNLQNPTASLIKNIHSTIKVYDKRDAKRKTPLYEDEKKDLEMAPNSNFDCHFRLGKKRIRAGSYVWIQDLNSPQGDWHFEQNFEITAAKVSDINKKDVTTVPVNIWLYVAISLICLLLLLLIIWIIRKQMKIRKEWKQLKAEAALKHENRDQ
jgi:hypothetical protein